jgi:hypothetical protein
MDRFVKWPLFTGLAIIAFWCVMTYWPIAQIAFSIIAILWFVPFGLIVIILLAVTMCFGFGALFHGRWRRLISMTAFPVALVAAVPVSILTDQIANKLTLELLRSSYMARINLAKEKGEHIVSFDWGGNVMIGVNRFLVWDDQDQIDLPGAQQTTEWKAAFRGNRLVQSFGDHFYLIETGRSTVAFEQGYEMGKQWSR